MKNDTFIILSAVDADKLEKRVQWYIDLGYELVGNTYVAEERVYGSTKHLRAIRAIGASKVTNKVTMLYQNMIKRAS
jgi:hypothetical protein